MLTVLFREIFPSKHARSDPEAVWLRLVKAVTASVQPESGRIVYAGPNFPHPIRFRSSKEGPDHIVQNRPGSDLNGWTGFGQTQKSGLEASRCAGIIGAGLWQDATGPPPVSHFPVCGRTQPAHHQFPTFRFMAGRNRPTTSFPLSGLWQDATGPPPVSHFPVYGRTQPAHHQFPTFTLGCLCPQQPGSGNVASSLLGA